MIKITEKFHTISNSAALICMLHCMLFPVLISVLPMFGLFLLPHWLDMAIILTGVLFSLMSLCWGYTRHKNSKTFLLLIAAFLWLWVAHDTHYPVLFSTIGAICMISANVLNRKLCRTCESKGCHNEIR